MLALDLARALAVTQGHARCARQDLPVEEHVREDLDRVIRASRRAALMAGLLRFLALPPRPRCERLDLSAVLADVQLGLCALRRGCEPALDLDCALPPIVADRGLLELLVPTLLLSRPRPEPLSPLFVSTARVVEVPAPPHAELVVRGALASGAGCRSSRAERFRDLAERIAAWCGIPLEVRRDEGFLVQRCRFEIA